MIALLCVAVGGASSSSSLTTIGCKSISLVDVPIFAFKKFVSFVDIGFDAFSEEIAVVAFKILVWDVSPSVY